MNELVDAACEHLAAARNFSALRVSGNSTAAKAARQRLQKADLRLQAAVDYVTTGAELDEDPDAIEYGEPIGGVR